MSTTPRTVADFETQLSTAIAIGATSFSIQSANDDDGVALPAGLYCFTIDNGSSVKEFLMGQLSGTSVTSVQSVSRQGALTSGAVRAHRVGASVIITDFLVLKRIADILSGDDTLDGTSPLAYDTLPTLSDPKELATVAYVLAIVNGGTVNFSSQTISATAGETLAGATLPVWCYFKEADQRWWKVDTDDSTTYENVDLGFAISTANAGASVTIQLSGLCSGFSALTAGSKYYGHGTAGTISTTVSASFIGWAYNTTTILMLPKGINIPTYNEKQALIGTVGVPSTNDKFVTNSNTSDGGTDQSQTTQNSSSVVGEASTTGLRNKLAQSFIPTYTKIRGVNLYKSADTGTFTGTVTISIQADSSGSPSGSALATVTLTNAQWEGFAVGEFEAIFASEYASMVQGSLYWIVIECSTADTSNHPNIGINTAGGYSSGSAKYYNATDTWVAISTIDLYFKTLIGTASQVVKTNSSGKIESNFYDVAEMPVPAYFQDTAFTAVTAIASNEFTTGSNADGSVLFLRLQGSGVLYRFQRDTYTGAYIETHSVTPTLTIQSGDVGSIIVIGLYAYMFSNDSTNIVCSRFLASDLTGEQVMSVPTVACTSATSAWTDGTYAYVTSSNTSTTSRKWSVSGTTFTAVSTVSVTSVNGDQMMSDGKNAYSVSVSGTTLTIKKFTTIDGSVQVTTTKRVPTLSDEQSPPFLVNIDNSRMYYGFFYSFYDETGVISAHLVLYPITKP